MAVTSIRNETPAQLTLIAAGGERMVLAPLQQKAIDDTAAFDFKRAQQDGLISLGEEAPGRLGELISGVALGGGFWIAIAAWGISYVEPPFGLTPQAWARSVWAAGAAILLRHPCRADHPRHQLILAGRRGSPRRCWRSQ